MTATYDSTLDAIRRERAARAEPETPVSDRTRVLNALAGSAPVKSAARALSIGVLVIVFVALALVAVATVPVLFGYHSYTINSGSMEPTLSIGDAAVVKPSSPRSLEIGDVIVRRDGAGGQPILHRIVDIIREDGELMFITQGDQNNAPDSQPIFLAGTGDKVIYSVPYAGYLLIFAESWLGRLLLIGLPIVLLGTAFAKDIQRAMKPARKLPSAPSVAPSAVATPAVARPGIIPAGPPALVAVPDVSRLADQLSSWALRRFMLRHSGPGRRMSQCELHPPIADMATLQVLAALQQETGIAASSQRIAETCAELGIPFARASRAAA